MLVHKNRYLRKFASQSLSYVLRKISFTDKTIKMVTNILSVENLTKEEVLKSKDLMTKVTGLSDMIFEVVYGAGEGLHSKFSEVMSSILGLFKKEHNRSELNILIRCLYMKLVNEIDTEKQQPLFEILDKELDIFDN